MGWIRRSQRLDLVFHKPTSFLVVSTIRTWLGIFHLLVLGGMDAMGVDAATTKPRIRATWA